MSSQAYLTGMISTPSSLALPQGKCGQAGVESMHGVTVRACATKWYGRGRGKHGGGVFLQAF